MPAYTGLSEEEQKLRSGEWVMHYCGNATPPDSTTCRVCKRLNVDAYSKQDLEKLKVDVELRKNNTKLKKENKTLEKKVAKLEEALEEALEDLD